MKRILALTALACGLAAIFAATPVEAQNAALLTHPRLQFFNANGQPLAGGLLYSYQAGTTTPLATYTDQTATTQNANPLTLDAGGFAPPVWIGASSYKFVLTDATGVQIWTQDNVRDLALLGTVSVSVQGFGAKGDGITDDSAAIAAACAAAPSGTVQFVGGLTYKLVSGNITTCTAGTTLIGNGATLDGTSANTTLFAFNIGGSPYSALTPTTIVQGFRVNGSPTNSSAIFVREDRIPNFIMRDVIVTGMQAAYFAGETSFSLVDNVTITAQPAYGVLFSPATYTSGPTGSLIRHLTCENGGTGSICVEVRAGEVYVSDPLISNVGIGFHIAAQSGFAANFQVRNGLISFPPLTPTNARGIVIDSSSNNYPNVDVIGTKFDFASSAIGIDNTASPTLSVMSAIFSSTSSAATAIRTSQPLYLNLAGNTFTSNQTGLNVFDLGTNASSIITNSVIASNLFVTAPNTTISLVKASPLGSISSSALTGNSFFRVTNFVNLGTLTTLTNNFFTGETTPSMGLSGATLTGNTFSANPASTISPKATNCSNNVGYGCN